MITVFLQPCETIQIFRFVFRNEYLALWLGSNWFPNMAVALDGSKSSNQSEWSSCPLFLLKPRLEDKQKKKSLSCGFLMKVLYVTSVSNGRCHPNSQHCRELSSPPPPPPPPPLHCQVEDTETLDTQTLLFRLLQMKTSQKNSLPSADWFL